MSESSHQLSETARKSLTLALQGLSDPGTQAWIAKETGQSEATISRLKTEHLPQVIEMLALLGLKVVKTTDITVDADRLRAVTLLAHHSLDTAENLYAAVTKERL